MTVDMADWRQLDEGVYVHKWRPQLLLVVAELGLAEILDREPTDADLHAVRRHLLADARVRYRDLDGVGIELHDVLIERSVSYVV